MPNTLFMTNGITIISLLFTILVLIILFIKKKNDGISSKVYFFLILVSLLSMILNITWGTLATTGSNLTKIFMKIFTFSVNCWNYLLVFYVAVVFKTKEENEAYYKKHDKISYVLGTILVLINIVGAIALDANPVLIEDTIYNIPGLGPYVMMGPLATFQGIVGAIALLYAIGTIIYYRKKIDIITKILCSIAIVICGLSIVLNLSGLLVQNDTSFLHAIVIMFLFLSIESQDRALLEEYNKSNEKAKESNQLKSEFIMNMSHQLRTPMNTILGFSESLLTNENLAQSELIDDTLSIEMASKRLLELINSILDISKIESNKEILHNEDYNLDTVIYDVSSHINSKIDKDNLIFTINANENCPNDLNGDGYKLAKILNIVLSNAVRYTNYGEVSLNVSSTQIDQETHEFTLHIKNTGHAMKQEDFNRSFEDLIKLTTDSNNDIDADTLKMIVAKGLIEIIGGTIDFINETGQGTQYIIKLKQKVTTQNQLGNIRDKIQTKHAITHSIVNLLGKKALIIDDQKINTIILQRLLNQYNIQIEATSNPKDGIDKATNNNYDIIFVNHEMDEMSGEEVVKKLEATGNKIPPVVGLLLGSNEMDQEYEYSSKLMCPIEFRELNNIMNKHFKENE